ncbi:hypothetical protein N7532_011614 [Penicillium argentinense]|uniref:Uncharacterized protein n=1 Tax=Penicillium argentinense TaxID=1131581 RepID=A0A9W9EIZ3_9EURO|nr:uncharacterized protein N7532_011614 [Penicillium argentinense]KAJ5082571.1 hypothetical protein N7532_011614 [Penicillium argentinense]
MRAECRSVRERGAKLQKRVAKHGVEEQKCLAERKSGELLGAPDKPWADAGTDRAEQAKASPDYSYLKLYLPNSDKV